jgi:hypothetical protein
MRVHLEKEKKHAWVEDSNILYSGECDWDFKIRICGIENLLRIFA